MRVREFVCDGMLVCVCVGTCACVWANLHSLYDRVMQCFF